MPTARRSVSSCMSSAASARRTDGTRHPGRAAPGSRSSCDPPAAYGRLTGREEGALRRLVDEHRDPLRLHDLRLGVADTDLDLPLRVALRVPRQLHARTDLDGRLLVLV